MKVITVIWLGILLVNDVYGQKENPEKVAFLKDCSKWNGVSYGALQGLDPKRRDSVSNLGFAGYYKVPIPYEIIFVYKASVEKRNQLAYPTITKAFDNGCSNLYADFNCFAFVLRMKDPSLQDDPNFDRYSFPEPVKIYKRITGDQWAFLQQITVKSYSEYRKLQFKTIYGL